MANAISRLFSPSDKQSKELSARFKDLKGKFDALKDKSARALQAASRLEKDAARMVAEMESLKMLCGRLATAAFSGKPADAPFADIEFKVFSQWGEDGIIQHLLRHLSVEKQFVEFGVESYTEASTRFLLMQDNWRGLVLDGSEENIARIKASDIHWRHDLTAVCAFITPENIDDLLVRAGFTGNIGIFSVDVDGMDYWIWKAVTAVRPAIVISEYNSAFGPHAAVTIPPDPAFLRSKAHHSNLFYGASLAALEHLAREKGYHLIGVNSAGNNAFFVRQDLASPFPARSAADVFVEAKFREARGADGKLTFASAAERRNVIAACEVFDVATGSLANLSEVWARSAP